MHQLTSNKLSVLLKENIFIFQLHGVKGKTRKFHLPLKLASIRCRL